MRRIPLLLPLIVAGLCVFASRSARASEAILSFHSDITVADDASLTVIETVEVRAEGIEISHGIYRDFPTDYRDRMGNRVRVGFKMLSAARDGRAEPFRVKRRANGVRVYLGDPHHYLATPQIYTYTLTYWTNRQIGFFDDHDELYWNVMGLDWVFPIWKASALVRLPQPVDAAKLTLEGYTGPVGSKEQAVTTEVTRDGEAFFLARRPLAPGEGLTIALGWPKGVVRSLSGWQKFLYFIQDNQDVLIAWMGLALILVYYLTAWYRIGRDPAKGTIIPHYRPPENVSPALMRYLIEKGSDNETIAASVIDLAVKGWITIEQEDKFFGKDTYRLTKRLADGKPLAPEEKAFYDAVFAHRDSIDLKNEEYAIMGRALSAIQDALEKQSTAVYFNRNRAFAAVGIGLSMLIALASATESLVAWPLVAFAFFFVQLVLTRGVRHWRPARIPLFGAAFLLVGVLSPGFGSLFNNMRIAIAVPLALIVGLNVVFWRLLYAPTEAGRKLLDAIEGFKMYLSVAEKDRLNLLNPPERTPELFERYLPYAFALGVEQKWSEQFADVFKHLEATEQAYRPAWYSGSDWSSGRPAHFAAAMGGSFAYAISSSATPPGSSSGGGGGGSSGGGGGGGGGGGW